MAYGSNGGSPAPRTVVYLLQQIDRISPYLSELVHLLNEIVTDPTHVEKLKAKLQPIIEIIKQRELANDTSVSGETSSK